MELSGQHGRYALEEQLSQGAVYERWRARGEGRSGVLLLRRLVEKLRADPLFLELVGDEARLTAAFDFPGVFALRDAGADFLVTDFVAGAPLSALVAHFRARREPMPLPMACAVGLQLSAALDRVHRAQGEEGRPLQVVHRDLCPETVWLGFDGEARLLDFTMARSALRSGQTQPGIIKGRFAYMSPEQVRGLGLDGRSDVFSLGTCVWELLAGARLFQGESDFATLDKVYQAEVPPLPPRVPQVLSAAVRRALAKEARDRTPSAGELALALAPFAAGMTAEVLGALWRGALAPAPAAGSLDALIRGTPHRGNKG